MDSEFIGTWQIALKFRDVNDHLATYYQHWQSDQQKKIMIKLPGTLPGKSSDGKRNNNECNYHNSGVGRCGGRQGNNGRGGRGRGRGGRGGRNNDNNDNLKFSCAATVTKRVTIRLIFARPRKMEMKNPTWFRKRILKIYFNLL
jgi:hypothetical protein